jgi:hypothetical protein
MVSMKESPIKEESFQAWAIVEIFGHQKFAGRVSEFALGGCNFVRVDVPELPARDERYGGKLPEQPAFTKLFGQGAIYSITLVSEDVARAAADQIRPEPITVYIPVSNRPALAAAADYDD